MLVGLAGGAASQLFQMLRESRADPKSTPAAAAASSAPASATDTAQPAASLDAKSAKALADFKSLLIDLQAMQSKDASSGAGGAAPARHHGHHHGQAPAGTASPAQGAASSLMA